MERSKRWANMSLWSGVLYIFSFATLMLFSLIVTPSLREEIRIVGVVLYLASLSLGACAVVFGFMALVAGKSQMKGAFRAIVIANVLMVPLIIIGVRCYEQMQLDAQPFEAGAISSLRTLSSGQEVYYAKFGSYATLKELGDEDIIAPNFARATGPESSRSGYYFTLTVDKDNWCCIANPIAQRGFQGYFIRSFFVSTDGVIYYNTEENSSEFAKNLGE